jgi:hypothetical protein
MRLHADDPLARALMEAIREGDLVSVKQLLAEHPGLAAVRIEDAKGGSRTPLHVAADWPGYFPNGPAVVAALVAAGAEVDARTGGKGIETPLHRAASSDDVEMAGAPIEAGAG